MNEKTEKLVKYGTAVLSIAVSILTMWLNERKQERLIEEKVTEAIANKN